MNECVRSKRDIITAILPHFWSKQYEHDKLTTKYLYSCMNCSYNPKTKIFSELSKGVQIVSNPL